MDLSTAGAAARALHQLVRERRTVQRFTPAPVDEGVLHRALDAARFAPNHKLTWPYRFTVVGPEGRGRLCALATRLKAGDQEPTPELVEKTRAKMLDPAHLVVASQRLAEDPVRRQEDLATAACAVLLFLLALHAEGVGGKWSTGKIVRAAETFDVLGLDARVEAIVAFVWVGVPELVPRPPPRPSLDDLLRRVP